MTCSCMLSSHLLLKVGAAVALLQPSISQPHGPLLFWPACGAWLLRHLLCPYTHIINNCRGPLHEPWLAVLASMRRMVTAAAAQLRRPTAAGAEALAAEVRWQQNLCFIVAELGAICSWLLAAPSLQ